MSENRELARAAKVMNLETLYVENQCPEWAAGAGYELMSENRKYAFRMNDILSYETLDRDLFHRSNAAMGCKGGEA